MSESAKGHHRGLGYKHTDEAKVKMSEAGRNRAPISEETRRKISEAHKGIRLTEEHKLKLSKTKRGNKHPQWQGGISFGKYCPKFNEKRKEKVRKKFKHRCFLCNKHELDNPTKLLVHHVDYNKDQGCNTHKWILIPLCRSCHAKTNFNRDYWEVMIMYMLENNYSPKQRKMSLINLDD